MRAYLGLGSNLGDRVQLLRDAINAIDDRIDISDVYETDPIGGPADQGAFLNLVVAIETQMTPREILEMCQRLETAAERVRLAHWGPRTLDVDVLLVGDLEVNDPDLVVPHPLWRERAFVVEPLRAVADAALAATLPSLDTTGVRCLGSLWGDWDLSIGPRDVAAWFAGWDGPWAVAGGWALELFVGSPTRPHHDLDMIVARSDAPKLHALLRGWELQMPSPAGFTLWREGDPLPDDVTQLWVRRSADGPWLFEILFEHIDVDAGTWRYRRDQSIELSLAEVILATAEGIPYVAPQVQLLYKMKARRARDVFDFDLVVPLLADDARAWLTSHTPHPSP